MLKTSVCIATYNGEKYILEQLNSILVQLNIDDEIIIVDDCSIDSTVHIINSFNDKRIKLYHNNKNHGYVYTFNRSIYLSSNEIIFLSDQDDIWLPNRINRMKQAIVSSKKMVLASNFDTIDNSQIIQEEISYRLYSKDSDKNITNIINIFLGKRSYLGCAMVFHRNLVKLIYPIPQYVESHDLWIALAGNILKSNLHLEEVTIVRRIHGKNASGPNRSIISKLKARIIFLVSLFHLTYRKWSI